MKERPILFSTPMVRYGPSLLKLFPQTVNLETNENGKSKSG